MTLDDFFAGFEESRPIFDALHDHQELRSTTDLDDDVIDWMKEAWPAAG